MPPKRKRKSGSIESSSKRQKSEDNIGAMQKYFKSALHCVDMPHHNQSFSQRKCESWFQKYADKNMSNQVIGPEGIENFCKDLQVAPEDIIMLVISWRLGAENMGFFKLTEWKNGMAAINCDNIQKLKEKLGQLRSLLEDPVQFKKIYRYGFDFARDKEQKSLDIETGKAMLELLLKDKWPLSRQFIEFLNQSKYKIINRDQWNSLLEFARTVSADFHEYDDEGAWPVMLDEFVEWYQEKNTMS